MIERLGLTFQCPFSAPRSHGYTASNGSLGRASFSVTIQYNAVVSFEFRALMLIFSVAIMYSGGCPLLSSDLLTWRNRKCPVRPELGGEVGRTGKGKADTR